jgi:predicted nucleic acid-binding protein
MGTAGAMNELIIIDTDILIDVARQVDVAVEYLNEVEQKSTVAISVITLMELLSGCRNKTEMRHTERFIQRFQVIKLSASISDTATNLLRQYRLSHSLAIPDGLIAATAIVLDQPLVSKNQRDYRFIKSLQLLPYPPHRQTREIEQ